MSGDIDRTVRWVHTSEIFDIATLLKGGEALLTSGLGLVGASDARLRAYARSLIDIDVGALLFEVGRTFAEVPPLIEEELRGSPVALVRLDGVVPFIDITESAHRLILDAESISLRASDRATTRLMDALLTGGGVTAVLATIAELTGAAAAFIDVDGHEVESSGQVPANARELERPVDVFGERRGLIRSAAAVTPDHRVVIDRGASALALELARAGTAMPTRRYAHERMIQSILRDDLEPAELSTHARSLGITTNSAASLVAAVATPGPGHSVDELYVHLVDTVARRLGPAIVGRLDRRVALVLPVPVAITPDALREQLEALFETSGTLIRTIAAGTVVSGWNRARTTLDEAIESAELAPLLGVGRVVLADDTALVRLLRSTDALDDFVTQQLGPVLDCDARRGTELLPTLMELFRHGGSRTAAAATLGVRRQTLYDRIDRIEGLLGRGAISDAGRAVALHVATIGWAISTRTASTRVVESAVGRRVQRVANRSR